MKIVCKKAISSFRGGKFFARGIFPTPLRARGPPGGLAKIIKTTPLPFMDDASNGLPRARGDGPGHYRYPLRVPFTVF